MSSSSSDSIGQLDYAPKAVRTPREPIVGLPLAPDGRMSRGVLWGTFFVITVFYALLWSPHWYPLSDSSLYLRMAKGLAAGRPIEFIRQVHRSIRPITPLMFSWVLRAGGGVGALHVLMIALMLVSYVLMFATLRRWFNERTAYWSTLLTAMSWWVFSNVTTIMTEPPFMVFFWGCLFVLSFVRTTTGWRQWACVIGGALLLAGAWGNRVAAIFFLPGVILGLFMQCRDVASLNKRLAWSAIIAGMFGLLLLDYFRPVPPPAPGEVRDLGGGGILGVDGSEGETEKPYRLAFMLGINNPVIQLPSTGGRWVLEVMVAGLYYPHKMGGPVLQFPAAVMAIAAFILLLVGWVYLARKGYWWAVTLALYYFPLWFMWGTRVKPRYMVPIAPILFIILWTGIGVAWAWIRRKRGNPTESFRMAAKWTLVSTFAVSLLLNGFCWWIEFYVRHVSKEEFYDVSRRGWNSDIIDICSYLKKNAPKEMTVYINRGAHRRMVSILSDHNVINVKKEVGIDNPQDKRGLSKALIRVHNSNYMIAFYDQPAWPRFHWPIVTPPPTGTVRWWQLYELDPATKTFKPVAVPRDRSSMDDVLVYDPVRR